MPDPSRQWWWREALPVGTVLVLAMVALSLVSSYRKNELRARTPEIVYGKLREFHPGGSRHLPNGPYLLVSFPNRTMRYLEIAGRDDRGCVAGSRVAIERRGMSLSLAPVICPDARVQER